MNVFTTYKNRPLYQKIISALFAFYLSLYLIVWALSSPVSKYIIAPFLQEQNLTLSKNSSISFNPFMMQLTIKDLVLFKNKEKVLSTENLVVRLTLFRLLFGDIVISKFQLNNAFLNITRTPEELFIAGIDITKDKGKTPEKTSPKAGDEFNFSHQVLLPQLEFNAVTIAIDNNTKHHQIKLNQFVISDLLASKQNQQANFTLRSNLDGTDATFAVQAKITNGKGEINSTLSLSEYSLANLHHYANDLSVLSGAISFESKQKIILKSEDISLHVQQATFTSKQLALGYQEQFFTLEKLQQQMTDLTITLSKGKISELHGSSQLLAENANVHYQTNNQKLAHFDTLSINDIALGFDNAVKVNINSFIVDDIFISKNESTKLPALVKVKQFSIEDISLAESFLSINKVIVDSFQSDIILAKDKSLENLVTLPITKVEQEKITDISKDVSEEVNSPNHNFTLSLGELSFINDNQISLLDKSVEPIKERKVYIDTLHIGSLSNSQEKHNQKTPFEFIGRSNKYAHFSFKGFSQPFADQKTHHLQGFLKELSLPAVSRYMKKAVQMDLKNGQLNTNIDVTLADEQLDGNIIILLQGIETAIADSDEAGALIDQGALPFNIAIGMLKDSHGDVELDVPISGSTLDPDFGISSIITLISQKAIWMATQDYLMTTFVPYANIVSVAMSVGEFALKLRFDDLIYQTKQVIPNEKQKAYLQAFIALMQDQEDARVNICAISVPADINLVITDKAIDKKNIRQLKNLAEQREEAFKEYIIKHGSIASSRLLLCAPKIDSSENAQPRIELSV
ncbi:MAG: DUF748 domain-containing protein [Colwellia sp.]